MPKRIKTTLLFCSILATGASETSLLQAKAQTIWDNAESSKGSTNKLIWGKPAKSDKSDKSVTPPITWDKVPEPERNSHQPSTSLVWEIIDANDSRIIAEPKHHRTVSSIHHLRQKNSRLTKYHTLESSYFKPIINLSHVVPTASLLRQEEWRLISTTISPFRYASGTGNKIMQSKLMG